MEMKQSKEFVLFISTSLWKHLLKIVLLSISIIFIMNSCAGFIHIINPVVIPIGNTAYAQNNNSNVQQNKINVHQNRIYIHQNKDHAQQNNNSNVQQNLDKNSADYSVLHNEYSKDFQYLYVYDDEVVTNIFNKIINANPDKLNFKDNYHKHGLAYVKVIKTNNSTNRTCANAFYITPKNDINNGYVYIVDSYKYSISLVDLIYARKYTSTFFGHEFKIDDIYVNSELASVLAHELGHYYDLTVLGNKYKNDGSSEDYADVMSAIFLGNIPEFSYGSAISDNEHWIDDMPNSKYTQDKNDNTHYSDVERLNRMLTFINKVSRGNVTIDYENNVHKNLGYGCFKVANKNVIVPDYSFFDTRTPGGYRANYVAGQIAWAIEHHLWKVDNLRIVPFTQIYPNYNYEEVNNNSTFGKTSEPKTVLILLTNSNDNKLPQYKIIDIFETDKNLLIKRVKEFENPSSVEFKFRDYKECLDNYFVNNIRDYSTITQAHDYCVVNENFGSYIEAYYLMDLFSTVMDFVD